MGETFPGGAKWSYVGNIQCCQHDQGHARKVCAAHSPVAAQAGGQDSGASQDVQPGGERGVAALYSCPWWAWPGGGVLRVQVVGQHRHGGLPVQPEVKLKTSVQVVKPTEGKVVSLGGGTRDILPVGRHMYELQLQYSFSLPKTAETILNLGILSDVLYESEMESQLWMVYDSNKRLLGSGDAYPSKWSIKLEKGDYTVRASVRHEKRELVEKFMDTPMLVSSKLSSPITLDVYSSHPQAQVGGKKISTVSISPGRSTPVYIAPLSTDKHSKGATLGQFLQGTATFAKDEAGKKADVYSFKYILPEGGKKKDKGGKEKEKKKEDNAAYEEAIRDCKISWLAKLGFQTKEAQDLT